jgi:hypothetical protein
VRKGFDLEVGQCKDGLERNHKTPLRSLRSLRLCVYLPRVFARFAPAGPDGCLALLSDGRVLIDVCQ